MLRLNIMRIILTIAMAASVLPGCSSEATDLCDDVVGDYRSVELGASYIDESGDAVPGVELLEIRDGYFGHFYSDIVDGGEWECSGNQLTVLDGQFEAELRMDGGGLILDQNGFLFRRDAP